MIRLFRLLKIIQQIEYIVVDYLSDNDYILLMAFLPEKDNREGHCRNLEIFNGK